MAKRMVHRRKLRKYPIGDRNNRVTIHCRALTAPGFESASFEETYDEGLAVNMFVETLSDNAQRQFDQVDIADRPTHLFVTRYMRNKEITKQNVLKWRGNAYKLFKVRNPEQRNQDIEMWGLLLGCENLEANK